MFPTTSVTIALRSLALLLSAAALSLGQQPPPPNGTDKLGWLAGCWQFRQGPMVVEETWTLPAGGTLLGMGRTIRGGKTVFIEYLQISEREGKLTYTARIGSPGLTHFPLVSLGDQEVTFENPQHDFPQRIVYLKSTSGITARVSGISKGTQRQQEFVYEPAPCRGN